MNIKFQLESERLIFRTYKADDLDEHVAILSNWDVTQGLSNNIPFPYSREAGKSRLFLQGRATARIFKVSP